MLSSIFKLNKSIIKNTIPPLKDITITLKGNRVGSNKNNANRLTPNEAKNPATYPIMVLLLFFGKWCFPKATPTREANPSPILVINAAAAKIPNGRKSNGTIDKTNITVLVNS